MRGDSPGAIKKRKQKERAKKRAAQLANINKARTTRGSKKLSEKQAFGSKPKNKR